ncbi:MAG: TolC family protein [Ignavibacteriales bacterium]|nr:MAG: TolC family protein [Ignavibacteriales bacterium]
MKKNVLLILVWIVPALYGQKNFEYYISKALENATSLNQLRNQIPINKLQNELDKALNSAFQISLTGNYLFAPYFNNSNGLITTNPDPKAIGYDVGITNGGLYSAQVNIQKNIFNGKLIDVLKNKNELSDKSTLNDIKIEEHNLRKIVIDQYLSCIQNLWLYNLTKEVSANLNEQLRITGGLVEKGFVKAQDYLLLKIEYKNQQMQLNEIWRNYKSGLMQLNSICGLQDTNTVYLENVTLDVMKHIYLSSFIMKYSIDSLALQNQQELFETKYQPQVNLFFNTGLNAVELENIQRKFGLSAGVNFSLPLFDGNQKALTRQQNDIYGKTIQQNRDYIEKNLFLQRQNGYEKIKSIKTSLDNLQDQIKDYDQVILLAQKQVEQGSMMMIEYLTILKNYIELQKNKIIAEINYQLEINNYNYWNW